LARWRAAERRTLSTLAGRPGYCRAMRESGHSCAVPKRARRGRIGRERRWERRRLGGTCFAGLCDTSGKPRGNGADRAESQQRHQRQGSAGRVRLLSPRYAVALYLPIQGNPGIAPAAHDTSPPDAFFVCLSACPPIRALHGEASRSTRGCVVPMWLVAFHAVRHLGAVVLYICDSRWPQVISDAVVALVSPARGLADRRDTDDLGGAYQVNFVGGAREARTMRTLSSAPDRAATIAQDRAPAATAHPSLLYLYERSWSPRPLHQWPSRAPARPPLPLLRSRSYAPPV
jgi:hypothetical protein